MTSGWWGAGAGKGCAGLQAAGGGSSVRPTMVRRTRQPSLAAFRLLTPWIRECS